MDFSGKKNRRFLGTQLYKWKEILLWMEKRGIGDTEKKEIS